MKRIPYCAAIVAFLCTALSAQTAQISGAVLDSSGSVVPNATVTVSNNDKGFQRILQTSAQGLFAVPLIPPGNYAVTVQAAGFQKVIRNDIILEVGQPLRLDFTLQPGQLQETITVEGGASVVQTESASVGTVVDRHFIGNMPLNGRSFQSLIELTPGVVAAASTSNNQGQFNINGQRSDANYFTIDGASANAGVGSGNSVNGSGAGALPATSASGGFNNLISVDALQEFKIETSSYAPEYGRASGGQISIVSRSGSNQFHGAVSDYLRNSALDANDWFLNSLAQPKPPLRQNDFGGVFHGPLIKNKLFFFYSYEGLRLVRPQVENTLVPTPFARSTSAAGIQPYLNAYPLPNCAASSACPTGSLMAQFVAALPGTSNLDAASIRIDYSVNSRMTLFGRYNYSPSSVTSQSSAVQFPTSITLQTATVGDTFIFSPAVVNDIRLNYTRAESVASRQPVAFGGAVPVSNSILFPLSSYTAANASSSISLGPGMDQYGTGVGNHNFNRQLNVVEALNVIKGAHEFKFGFDYRRLTPSYTGAIWGFSLTFNSASAWSSGVANSGAVSSTPGQAYLITNYSGYAQDTWKLNSRTTLTYGLRYDVNPGLTGRNGTYPFALANFDPLNIGATGVQPFGSPAWKTNWNNLAPRIGIAYQLSKDERWARVLRAGFGQFYDSAGSAAGFTFGPNTTKLNLINVALPLSSVLNLSPIPVSFTPPFSGNPQTTDPNLQMPYVFQYNASFQQGLGKDRSLSVSYVGSQGRRLLQTNVFFPAVPNPVFPGAFIIWRSTAESSYNALQTQFQQRLSHGLQVLASYAWSHSIDSASVPVDTGGTNGVVIHLTNAFVSQDRSSSDFDVRHSFQAAVSYDIPSPGSNRIVKSVLGHWGLDSIFKYRSAVPVNISIAQYRFLAGGTVPVFVPVRPDLVGGVPVYLSDPRAPGGVKLNPAAFSSPPIKITEPIRQGNLDRNALRGFGASQLDLSVRRDFPVTERIHLEFRGDLFNLLNHPDFANYNNLVGYSNDNTGKIIPTVLSNFGLSPSMLANGLGSGNGASGGGFNPLYQMGGPRSVQLSLKLRF